MFGIDFSELVVILIVALIVVGPQRLPTVARTLGHLWARAQRYINSVKTDISRDMAMEELHKLRTRVQHEVQSAEDAMSQAARSINQQAQNIRTEAERTELPSTPQIPRRSTHEPEQKQFPID